MAKKHFLANEKCTLKIAQNSQFQQCWDFDFSMAFPDIDKWSGEDRIHTLGPIWIKFAALQYWVEDSKLSLSAYSLSVSRTRATRSRAT